MNGTTPIFAILQDKLLPNHKILGPEQLKYMDDKRSLCFKIYAEIEIPDTIKTNVDNPSNNGAIFNEASIIKSVMSSAAEAEIGALYINARKGVEIRNILKEMGAITAKEALAIGINWILAPFVCDFPHSVVALLACILLLMVHGPQIFCCLP